MNIFPSTTSVLAFPEAGLSERLGPPETLDSAQQEATDELTNGPRGGVYDPFRPLLHRPPLLRSIATVGETLRYDGTLEADVARELSNVFEWDVHVPLAASAGVSAAALAALDAGLPPPVDLRSDLALARTVARELINKHRLRDETYSDALRQWGEPKVVELHTLVGYFTTVCWLMNVARTPGPAPVNPEQ